MCTHLRQGKSKSKEDGTLPCALRACTEGTDAHSIAALGTTYVRTYGSRMETDGVLRDGYYWRPITHENN